MLSVSRLFLILSSISGFLSVALGAFGAHALKAIREEYHLKIYHTGVEYQFFHTFALALVGVLLMKEDSSWLRASGVAFLAGIFFFSGSLYLLTLTKVGRWGAVTPLGGLLFMVGWALLGVALMKRS